VELNYKFKEKLRNEIDLVKVEKNGGAVKGGRAFYLSAQVAQHKFYND